MVSNYSPSIGFAYLEPFNASSPVTNLNVLSCQFTLDRTWSPYVQGTIVVPAMSPADATAADPRKGLVLSSQLALTPSGLPQTTLGIIAFLRSRSTDFVAGTTTLTFAGGESMLQDDLWYAGPSYSGTQTENGMITNALQAPRFYDSSAPIFSSWNNLDGTAYISMTSAQATPGAGQSLWDYIQSLEDASGAWLRFDETGALVRSAPTYAVDSSTHTITADTIVNVVDSVSRDSPDWGNLAVITYTNGGTSSVLDYSTTAAANLGNSWAKYVQQTRSGAQPKAGAADKLAARSVTRGRTLVITAVADFAARPNMTYKATFTAGSTSYTWTGTVQAVTFRYPEGLMDLTLNITNG